jgi:hypothetical protein
LQTPLRPQNTRVFDLTEGSESEEEGESTSDEDSDEEESSSEDEEASDELSDEEGIYKTIEEDFEPVRRSPRKPVPSQKALESGQIRIQRLPDNPKGASIDRNDQQNALRPYFAPLRASWDDVEEEQPRRNRRKTCKYDGCKEGGICDPPRDASPEDLPVWTNPEYSVLPRNMHTGKVNLPEDLTDPLDL